MKFVEINVKMKIIGIAELSIGKTCYTKSKIGQPVP